MHFCNIMFRDFGNCMTNNPDTASPRCLLSMPNLFLVHCSLLFSEVHEEEKKMANELQNGRACDDDY